jgi:hypothetical protein
MAEHLLAFKTKKGWEALARGQRLPLAVQEAVLASKDKNLVRLLSENMTVAPDMREAAQGWLRKKERR